VCMVTGNSEKHSDISNLDINSIIKIAISLVEKSVLVNKCGVDGNISDIFTIANMYLQC